jgi:hypothetical protein
MPERPGHWPGRSEAESIDDAELGASIIRAMVAWPDSSAWSNPVPPDNRTRSRTDCDASRRPTSVLASMHEHAHAGDAILLHGLGAQTRTRDTTNDGVNDPVRAPRGQVPGTAVGSFTPSLVQ